MSTGRTGSRDPLRGREDHPNCCYCCRRPSLFGCCCCWCSSSEVVSPQKPSDSLLEPKGSVTMEDKGGTEEDEENVARMSGYLEKKGKSRLVSIWHRYWFVLEGKNLTYYETQPQLTSETPPPCKGSFILTSATSVTSSVDSLGASLGSYNSHHSSHFDIYILTPFRLITLRTKDVDQHKQWMQALLISTSFPTKDQAKNNSSSSKTAEIPLRPSSKHFRYSLTNLTSNDEKNLALRAKSSHTMDNRTQTVSKSKSENADNIINRYIKRNRSNADEDSSSTGDDSEETVDKDNLVRSDDTDFPAHHLPIVKQEHVFPTRQKVEERKERQLPCHGCMDEVNPIYVSDESHGGSLIVTMSDMDRNSGTVNSNRVKEPKQSQAQGSKPKSRKFFNMKEPKNNDESSKSHKTFKKSKESENMNKCNITQQLAPKHNEKQKTKSEQTTKKNSFPKDDILLEANRPKQLEFVNDPTIENDHMKAILSPKSPSQAAVTDPESKSSKKMLKKKGKSKKDGKGNENSETTSRKSNYEGQSNPNSKQLKDCEALEDVDPRKKKKKISFFSKMLKGKKIECPEETAVGIAVDEKLIVESDPDDSVDDPVSPVEEPLKEEKKSTEEETRTIIVPQKPNFGMKVILANDEELMKKLQSRMKRIETEEQNSDEVNASPKLSKKLPVPTPRERSEVPNKLQIPDITLKNSSDRDTPENLRLSPNLPPRVLPKPPPSPYHDKPRNNYFASTPSYTFGEVTLKPIGKNLLSPNSFEKTVSSEEAERTNHLESRYISISNNAIMNSPTSISSHSDLDFEVSEQKSIPELVSTATEVENMPWSEIYETEFCNKLDKMQDATSEPSVDAIQDLKYTPPSSSCDLTANYECNNNSHTGKVLSVDSSSNHAAEVNIETKCTTSNKEMSDNPVRVVDELERLMNELDRINSSPLENPILNENQRPVSEENKESPTVEEDFITTYPIRRRRNSDPDYDIPRPHRLPPRKEANLTSQDGNASTSTNNYDGDLYRQGTDSITIEATYFFGSGIDYCFDENKYFGSKEKSDMWDDQSEDKIQVMNYMGSHSPLAKTVTDSSEMVKEDRSVNRCLDDYSDSSIKQNVLEANVINNVGLKTNEMVDEKCVDGKEEEFLLTAENNALLRVNKIDRTCRNERSRELHEDEFDVLQLKECIEGFSISRTSSKEELEKTKNPENIIPALIITETEKEKHDSTDHLDNMAGEEENAADDEVSFEVVQREVRELSEMKVKEVEHSEKKLTQKIENTSESMTASALKRKDWHEDGDDNKRDENEVFLRQKPRYEDEDYARKEHRTLRLSFATTETLIVEEEVLVATLKTTTTASTALPSSSGETKKENIEELVDEVVLDMDTIADDHFGSMQVQSCIQT